MCFTFYVGLSVGLSESSLMLSKLTPIKYRQVWARTQLIRVYNMLFKLNFYVITSFEPNFGQVKETKIKMNKPKMDEKTNTTHY